MIDTQQTITCIIKRLVSGMIGALSSVSAALVVLPKDVSWQDLPLGVVVASAIAFFAGIYTPPRNTPKRLDDISTKTP